MLPIFGNQLLWRYFSVLGPITQMGRNGSLALAGAALGESSLSSIIVCSSSRALRRSGFFKMSAVVFSQHHHQSISSGPE